MRGNYYYHPNWESSVPSQKDTENSTTERPSFPSFMYESPCPSHNYHCHPFPSSPMQCCHSCCHNSHGHHYPLHPSPTPHPYTYSPPPPYYHPHCCGGGGGCASHHPQPATYAMPCYGYVPPPDYADPSGYECGKGGRGEILYPCGGGFPRPPYPYGRKREDGNVKIEEHEEDPDSKDTTLNLVPAGNGGFDVFPYPWVPSGYKENKNKGKRDKPPLGREAEERLQVPDHVMKPGSYYVDPKAFEQEPNRWKGGWFPLDMDNFGSPSQGGERGREQKQQEQQKGQKSNQIPVIWMPYYGHPAENDDDQARDRKGLSTDTKIRANEQPPLHQSDGIKRTEEDHENRVRKEKSGNLKIIPVKQIHDEEPVQMSGTNKDAELKKSDVSPGKSVDESMRNKESNGGNKKSKTLSPTKPRLPPVCLRVDPLPKKNKNGKSSSGRSPPPSSRKEQKEGGDSVNSIVPSASKEEAIRYDDSDKRVVSTKDKSNAEQSSKKEIRVTDAVDSSASQNRIEASRNHSKHAGTEISKASADQDKASSDVAKVVKGEEAPGVCASIDSQAFGEERDGHDGAKKRVSGEVKPVEEKINEPEKKKKIMSGTEAAIVIQSAYRGYEVRRWQLLKKLKNIAKVRGEASQLRSRIEAFESANYVGLDFSKEKSALAETIMKLLLDLDTIQGLHPSFRDTRKALASELVNLQEKLESITVNEKVGSFDGKISFGEPAVANLDEGLKIGEEREIMIQEDTSPDFKQVSENGSIATLDATTSSNSENVPELVHDEAQDRSNVEVATTTKVEETEASSLEEHVKVHCVAASELADKDAQRESQDDIMVLESSSIEERGECDNGELIMRELQGRNEEVLDGCSGFSRIEAHSQPMEEADVATSLVDSGPSENQDGGVIDNVSAESTIEEMAKSTHEEVKGQEDSIASPTLGEVQEVDLLADMPQVAVDEKPVVPESMQQEFAEITSSGVAMDIASMPDSGDIDAREARLAETLNEGLCCGELHDASVVECRESGEYPQDASSEPERLRDVEITDETGKISEEKVSPSDSFQPNMVGENENHGETEIVAEKAASCAENNETRDDTERGNNGIDQPSGIELAVNDEAHGSGISIRQSNEDGGIERPGGTELAVKEVPGRETSSPHESSECSSKGSDETEPLSHSRGERAQHALHKEPETNNQLTQENKMLKEMIEKLVESGKEQQDVIFNLSGKVKELEKKLVKKKNTKAKTGKRPRILIHRSSFTKPKNNSALGQALSHLVEL